MTYSKEKTSIINDLKDIKKALQSEVIKAGNDNEKIILISNNIRRTDATIIKVEKAVL